MTAFVGLRLAQSVLVLFAVTLLASVLIYASGDPARAMVPLDARPEDVEAMRRAFGLDQPIYVQYLRFLQKAAEGDLGESLRYRTGALPLAIERGCEHAILSVVSVRAPSSR